MATAVVSVAPAAIPTDGPRTRWERVFLFLVGALASTILLKVGAVQYLEIVYFLQIGVLLAGLARKSGRASVLRPLARIGINFALAGLIGLALSVSALRYNFYIPPDLPLLHRPVYITLSRLAELGCNVFMMLYLANQYRLFPGKARFTIRVYFWTGVASGIYSLLSYPLDVAGIVSLGSYLVNHRLRGFYNEAGPYGVYAVTVVVVGYVLYRLGWESKQRIWAGWIVFAIVLPMTYSKAGFSALLVFLLLAGFFSRGIATKLAVLGTLGVALFVTYQIFDVNTLIRLYRQTAVIYEKASHLHPTDPNFVSGRSAGLFLVPRMVEEHPLAGIGWGNYSLVRNSPEYRGASVWVEGADDPSIGILGLTADLGLPLFFYLVLCLVMPFLSVRSRKVPSYLINLALVQPVAHLCGAQLNLTYPWVVTSFALGLTFMWTGRSLAVLPRQAVRLPPTAV